MGIVTSWCHHHGGIRAVFYAIAVVTCMWAGEVGATTTATATQSILPSPPTPAELGIIIEQIPGNDIQIGDFVVGPGRAEFEVAAGRSVTREITITNRVDDNRTFEFTVQDMSGSADGRDAVVLLGDQDGPYSLRDYVSLPVNRITLRLGERARIPVTVTMQPNAEPGGYYGAVLASTVQDDGEEIGVNARSPIVARIGTLLFITVPGTIERSSQLIDFSTLNKQRFFTTGPIDFVLANENTGTIHLNPYGELRVTNMLGAEVGYVELDPWFVLPKAIRTREITWTD